MHNEQIPRFRLIIVGDEILSGKRADKHLPKVIELLKERGLQLDGAEYVGDDPDRITQTLQRAFASRDVVFSTGGIGATPDDHTRQCAARALGVPLQLHTEAKRLIEQRGQENALEHGLVYESQSADNLHRLNMGVFPLGADIIPNPFNRIPGFSCARVHFVPGFPVMAWPMLAWVLDNHYRAYFQHEARQERSVIVFDAMEATLTPLMECIERDHENIKVFSLPSVDHPELGRHIEVGIKGATPSVGPAYAALLDGLTLLKVRLGTELVQ